MVKLINISSPHIVTFFVRVMKAPGTYSLSVFPVLSTVVLSVVILPVHCISRLIHPI